MRTEPSLLHDLPRLSAERSPDSTALIDGLRRLSYGELVRKVDCFAGALAALGVGRGERVAIHLDKRLETVVASFAAPACGAVFVPVNPLLKAEQVAYILRDCGVRVLVTSPERLQALGDALATCAELRHVVVTGATAPLAVSASIAVHTWDEVLDGPVGTLQRVIDVDTVAILYTSGSTGLPKGVVLSHRNMVAGARSVAGYLENEPGDVLLAALPLSFDAGFSQLTTAFHAGASVVLLNYLLPRDVVNAVAQHGVTGLTAVPPLWMQLAQVAWPAGATKRLRYFANTGGRMPLETLKHLRDLFPQAKPYLMYGLTEAFRATFLAPEEVDRRPDSIGKAIPNAEILVLRPDGSRCEPGESGELVQRGALVGKGYWNDAAKTAERFRPLRDRDHAYTLPEIAVFSGDTVREDAEGFLYFIGRKDEMIKSSGYRISPSEVEEVLHSSGLVAECVAFGVPHDVLGEAVVAIVAASGPQLDLARLQAHCRERMPAYMLPSYIEVRAPPLPRNANGKIDRKSISADYRRRCGEAAG